jgi:hypothetical protein
LGKSVHRRARKRSQAELLRFGGLGPTESREECCVSFFGQAQKAEDADMQMQASLPAAAEFGAPVWLKALALITLAAFVGAASATCAGGRVDWMCVGFSALSVAGVLAVGEVFRTRVILESETLIVVRLFSRRCYPRSSFTDVGWEKASPVALRNAEGRWVRFPEVVVSGPGVATHVRRWLQAH